MTTKLTPKQQAFVDEYLVDLNATKAAERAGYSSKSAKQTGTENLAKPAIKEAINKALAERSERTQINADWVLKTLAEVWDADIADILEPVQVLESGKRVGGTLRPPHEWPPIWRKIVVGFDCEELFEGFGMDRTYIGDLKKLKILGGKQSILKMIGDHVGVKAFSTNIKVEGKLELIEKMARGQQRAQSRISKVEEAVAADESTN